MPLFTFECSDCGHRADLLKSIGELITRWPCPNTRMDDDGDEHNCLGKMIKVPSLPGPPRFNCEMPTYQKPKEIR